MNEQAIFTSALERPQEERSAYLNEACGADEELRHRVERLLRLHDEAGSFLESPVTAPSPTVDQPRTEQPGDSIGPYKLLQLIGEGGMGVVYMAEQTEPVERRVALKIIKPGLDTRQVIARFEAERQALAMMDHPNIAKVLDAGTTDTGRPYFVMELVKGLPVTQYCDEKQLSPRERLELFVPICQAVQHAHQKGIIHRDIKPTNVLVALYDDQAVPKIIDFGVAKATSQRLTKRTLFTEFGQVVGTPEYMSPEQAQLNHLDVDTRTDVYSMGVLLYELLVGETPFDRQRLHDAAFDELLRIIREEEPPRPSDKLSTSESLPTIAANRHVEPQKLSTLVHGELDWIVMKAMEKDRNRRYDTASKFAEDVEHYLRDEAVTACPPSAAYRFRKFTRRNKAAIAMTVATAALLLLGIVGTSWQAIRASREAARADAEAETAKAVNDFLQEDLLGMAGAESQAEAQMSPDPDIKLRTLLDRAADNIGERFADQLGVQAAICHTIGVAYKSIGEHQRAESLLLKALEIRRRTLGEEHSDTLSSMNNLGTVYDEQGRYQEAEALLQRTVEIRRRTLGEEHRDTLRSMQNLGMIYGDQGRYKEAEALHRQTLEIRRRTLGDEHPDTLMTMNNLAIADIRQGRYVDAKSLFTQTLEIRRRTLGNEHPSTIRSMQNLATTYATQGREAEAMPLYEETLDILRRTLGDEHPHTLQNASNLATTYKAQGRYEEAETLGGQVVESQRRTLGEEHPSTLSSMINLANVYKVQRRYAEAEALHRQTLEILRRTLGEEHRLTLMCLLNLASTCKDQGRYGEAEKLYDQTLAMQRRTLGEEHPDTRRSVTSLSSLCWPLATAADPAKRDPAKAVELAKLATEVEPNRANHWDNLGVALYRNGQLSEAVETLEKARAMRGGTDPYHQFFLAMAYWQTGQQNKARENYKEAALWMLEIDRGEEHHRFKDEAESLIKPNEMTEDTQDEATHLELSDE